MRFWRSDSARAAGTSADARIEDGRTSTHLADPSGSAILPVVTTPVSPARAKVLQAVFGDVVPKDAAAALRMLEDSPALSASPAERAALRDAVVAAAGRKLFELAPLRPTADPPPAAQGRPLPAGVAIRLVEVALAEKTGDGLLKAVSPERAKKLFDEAAAMKDIPWTFLEEGCIHRAHVLAKRLEDKGIFSEKVFAIPNNGEDLVIESDKARLGYTVCWFHVANVVHVVGEDGARRRLVIDPAVADAPLPVEEWAKRMHGAHGGALETFFLPRFASQLYHRDAPPLEWSLDELEHAHAWAEDAPLLEADYVKSGFYAEVAKLAGREPPPWSIPGGGGDVNDAA